MNPILVTVAMYYYKCVKPRFSNIGPLDNWEFGITNAVEAMRTAADKSSYKRVKLPMYVFSTGIVGTHDIRDHSMMGYYHFFLDVCDLDENKVTAVWFSPHNTGKDATFIGVVSHVSHTPYFPAA